MTGIELSLKEDFPEATAEEITRFVAAYGNGRGSTERITRGEAEQCFARWICADRFFEIPHIALF